MSMTIISCPSCDTILLADTVQCPSCRHVLQPDRFALMSQAIEAQERAAASAAAGEAPCPACGEGIRPGLIRCFNCGTYLTSDAAQTDLQNQATTIMAPTEGGYFAGVPLPDNVSLAPEDPPSYAPESYGEEETTVAEDDDFEISPAYTLRAPTAHLETYSLAWGNQAQTADEEEVVAEEVVAEEVPAEPQSALAPSAVQPVAAPANTAAATAASPASAPQEIPLLDETAHSVATAGDVLLKNALDEENAAGARRGAAAASRASAARKGKRRTRPVPRTHAGLIVYCPNGHQIEAQSKHRGLMGRCPKCKMPFFVPNLDLPAAESQTPADGTETVPSPAATAEPTAPTTASPLVSSPAAVSIGGIHWLGDMCLHAVNPAKLKPKPGCLAKSFQKVDVAIRSEGLLVVTLVKPGGLFGLGGKKPEPMREAVRAHLAGGKPLAELPAASQQEYPAGGLPGLTVAQPAPYAHESPFGDVPVFGEGRIAVKLPDVGEGAEKQYLSFSLSQFRQFAALIRAFPGLESFAETSAVPLSDSSAEHVCHYSETKLKALNDVPYYQNDPAFTLEIIGRKCAECGLIVGEDARKKEKIGGLDGKGVAKAKCPKCQKKFGSISLFGFGTPAK